MSVPLDILYPNGKVEAVQVYIWVGGQPVVWDGSVTVSVTSSGSAIEDGAVSSIKATVKNYTNSHPLCVINVDTNGDPTGGSAVSIADGADVTEGALADVKVVGDNSGSISAKLRGINSALAGTLAVNGPLTDTQLRATAVPISGALTDTQLRASAVPVSGTVAVTGVATATNQTGGSQKTQVVDGSGNVIGATSNALDINIKSGNPTSITANAGTNLNTSALALEAGNLATVAGIVSSARAAVNPISGQSGVTGGSGVVGAAVQRVVLATDVALPTGTNTLGSVNILQAKTIKTVSGSLTADTDVIAAVTSKRLKIFAYSFFTFGTSASTILFKTNGTGGTELWRICLQSISSQVMGANLSIALPSFLFATAAGEKLTIDVGNGDTIHYSISYWDDDAT